MKAGGSFALGLCSSTAKCNLHCRVLLIVLAVALSAACDWFPHDRHPEVERDAKATVDHPLAGFWKSPTCDSGEFGLAIGPMAPTQYYVSFCGPGGCFEKGTYRPLTTIYNDEHYRVNNENSIDVKGLVGSSTYVRCRSRTSSVSFDSDLHNPSPRTRARD
jgi:hypothetical protein